MRRLMLLSLFIATSASAIPSGPLTGYAGEAWFTVGQGIVVTGATYAECQQRLQDGINYRVTNWGWVVTSVTNCRKRGTHMVAPGKEVFLSAQDLETSATQATQVIQRDKALRESYNIEAYEQALETAFQDIEAAPVCR